MERVLGNIHILMKIFQPIFANILSHCNSEFRYMLKKFKVYLEYVTLINPKQECANQDYAMVKGILYD